MNWDGLDFTIIGPAFLAGLLVLSTHVPLGKEVLQRGIIFIDLAIAQIAGLGVIAANTLDMELSAWQTYGVAAISAILGALLLHWSEKYWKQDQEALIGVVFVLAATLSILLLANNPHGGEYLQELLTGQILWVSYNQLFYILLLYIPLLIFWFISRNRSHSMSFYICFALAVTASVQLVGVYLVFASLIIPALATNRVKNLQLFYAYLVGIIGYGIGLVTSSLTDLPSGAVIVWSLAITGIGWRWVLTAKG